MMQEYTSNNRRMMAELVKTMRSVQSQGDMTGTNLGAIGVSQGPNGTFYDFDPPALGTFQFLGVLVSEGPNAEADYTDARYWIREVMVKQVSGDTPTTLPTLRIATGGLWCVGINLSEVASGTHSLPVYAGEAESNLIGSTVTVVWVSLVDGVVTGVATDFPVNVSDNGAPPGNPLYVFTLPIKPALARITAVSGSFPAWSYTVKLLKWYNSANTGASRWVTTGSDITGVVNRMEFAPESGYPYIYGNGSNITASDGTVDSGSCVIIPIGVGAVVDLTAILDTNANATVYSFAQANSAEAP